MKTTTSESGHEATMTKTGTWRYRGFSISRTARPCKGVPQRWSVAGEVGLFETMRDAMAHVDTVRAERETPEYMARVRAALGL
jgi:hypothetical protein